MALINCWECNKELSDSAVSCPHCGAKTENTFDIGKHLSLAKAHSRTIFCVLFSVLLATLLSTNQLYVRVWGFGFESLSGWDIISTSIKKRNVPDLLINYQMMFRFYSLTLVLAIFTLLPIIKANRAFQLLASASVAASCTFILSSVHLELFGHSAALGNTTMSQIVVWLSLLIAAFSCYIHYMNKPSTLMPNNNIKAEARKDIPSLSLLENILFGIGMFCLLDIGMDYVVWNALNIFNSGQGAGAGLVAVMRLPVIAICCYLIAKTYDYIFVPVAISIVVSAILLLVANFDIGIHVLLDYEFGLDYISISYFLFGVLPFALLGIYFAFRAKRQPNKALLLALSGILGLYLIVGAVSAQNFSDNISLPWSYYLSCVMSAVVLVGAMWFTGRKAQFR